MARLPYLTQADLQPEDQKLLARDIALAMLVFLTVTIYGFVRHGTHFLNLFLPSGVPITSERFPTTPR